MCPKTCHVCYPKRTPRYNARLVAAANRTTQRRPVNKPVESAYSTGYQSRADVEDNEPSKATERLMGKRPTNALYDTRWVNGQWVAA